MEDEWYNAEDQEEPWWDEFGEKPPEVTEEELVTIDRQADLTEIQRLMQMGVARFPREDEDLSEHSLLTTKLVRDWAETAGLDKKGKTCCQRVPDPLGVELGYVCPRHQHWVLCTRWSAMPSRTASS